jgi:ADP-heptose:LPS heptosyltransferase
LSTESRVHLLRSLVRRSLTLLISPRAFVIWVGGMRAIGLLRKPNEGQNGLIKHVFVSHPYSSVGDMVLLLPFLERIRAEWPAATIDVAAGSNASDLLAGVEGLSQVFDTGPQNSKLPVLGRYLRLLRHICLFRRKIMNFDYDLAIAPRWGSEMTADAVYLAYLTGARLRVGYSSAVDGGRAGLDKLLTNAAIGGWHEHETARSIGLLYRAGLTKEGPQKSAVELPIDSLENLVRLDRAKAGPGAQFLKSVLLSERYAVVSPGATNKCNIWPSGLFADAIRRLNASSGIFFYVIGSRSDEALCKSIVEQAPHCSRSLAGQTNMKQLVALLASAKLFIGADSGTAHIAGGLGVHTIVVTPFPAGCKDEHPRSPVRFRPCGPFVHVLQPGRTLPPCDATCSFPGSHCIEQIRSDDVVNVANGVLQVAAY